MEQNYNIPKTLKLRFNIVKEKINAFIVQDYKTMRDVGILHLFRLHEKNLQERKKVDNG